MTKERKSGGLILLLILLAAILLVLAVVIVLTLTGDDEPETPQTTTASAIVLKESDYRKITGISYTAKGKTVSFLCENGAWRYTGEEQFPLNNAKILQMLNQLAKIKANSKVADSCEDPSDFALDAPSVTVTFTLDGKDVTFKFGAQNHLRDNAYYGIMDGDPAVYLFAKEFVETFSQPLAAMAFTDAVPTVSDELIIAYQLFEGEATEHPRSVSTQEKVAAVSKTLEKIRTALAKEDLGKFAACDVSEEAWQANYGFSAADSYTFTMRYIREVEKEDEGEGAADSTEEAAPEEVALSFSLYFGTTVGEKCYFSLSESHQVYYLDAAILTELTALFV